jgi:NADH-quinone oxidoreductase subunit G
MMQLEMVNLVIDGKAVTVPKGTTVFQATRQLGIDVPIFCYQDRMPPFGACRVCLVEVEKSPKLQTSCTLEATEGMVVKTQSQMAVDGRKGILEFLLLNHPLDCPICDRGGECPLQEHALRFGPGESRFFEEKRHFTKPVPRGPVLMLDRERCIICARCTRFGDLVAGDHALEFIERGFKTEVGTPDGGPAESKFIGNTIMICPVGALTSQVYRFRARPWDNDSTNTTCTLCPVGCSMILDSRDGEIMRTRSQENRAVNDIWMCDKGWFGYEFVYHPDRLKTPLIRRNGILEEASWDEALTLVADKIREYKPSGKLAGVGGNTLTTEDNYLFQRLIREGAGVNNVDHRVGMPIMNLDSEGISTGMEMPIQECEDLSYAIICGLDLTEEFPVIWLRLRQAINKGAKVLFLGHFAPEIASYFSEVILFPPGKERETLLQNMSKVNELTKSGRKGAIFVGRQFWSNPERKLILSELVKIRQDSTNLSLNIMEGRGNSYGARYAGMHPELGPHLQRLSKPGLPVIEVLRTASTTGWDFLYVAGADPAYFTTNLWANARSNLKFMVVQDLFLNDTARQADVVLPALSYIEKGGTFINIEGRAQTIMPGKEIPQGLLSDSEIFIQVGAKLGLNLSILDFKINPPKRTSFSIDSPNNQTPSAAKNGTLSASFAKVLFDNGVRMKHNPHVVKLAKEPRVRIHPFEAAKRGLADGDRVVMNNITKAKIKLDHKISEGTIVIPMGYAQIPVRDLSTYLLNGVPIDIVKEST